MKQKTRTRRLLESVLTGSFAFSAIGCDGSLSPFNPHYVGTVSLQGILYGAKYGRSKYALSEKNGILKVITPIKNTPKGFSIRRYHYDGNSYPADLQRCSVLHYPGGQILQSAIYARRTYNSEAFKTCQEDFKEYMEAIK